MKKCQGCEKEIDKLAIACEYCGKVEKGRDDSETDKKEESKE